jgi:hypothetical protein
MHLMHRESLNVKFDFSCELVLGFGYGPRDFNKPRYLGEDETGTATFSCSDTHVKVVLFD